VSGKQFDDAVHRFTRTAAVDSGGLIVALDKRFVSEDFQDAPRV
jgi:hypothetical protein